MAALRFHPALAFLSRAGIEAVTLARSSSRWQTRTHPRCSCFHTSRPWGNQLPVLTSPIAEPDPQLAVPRSKEKHRELKGRKAVITLAPSAVQRLSSLLESPDPKLIRIGVRQKGCAGMSYHLEYVDRPGKFDEVVEQDGVKVLVDSKALFSIIGSEMEWIEDRLSARFIFHNPNIKDSCGCGESFNLAI